MNENSPSISKVIDGFPGIKEFRAGSAKVTPARIRVKENTKPVKQNIRKKAVVEKDIIELEVAKMLELGVIRPSCSPWSSPIQ